jgi:hypothetical protein
LSQTARTAELRRKATDRQLRYLARKKLKDELAMLQPDLSSSRAGNSLSPELSKPHHDQRFKANRLASQIEEAGGVVPAELWPREASYEARALLQALASNPNLASNARASAARTLAEMDGLIGRYQQAPQRAQTTALAELSRAELEDELARLRESFRTRALDNDTDTIVQDKSSVVSYEAIALDKPPPSGARSVHEINQREAAKQREPRDRDKNRTQPDRAASRDHQTMPVDGKGAGRLQIR